MNYAPGQFPGPGQWPAPMGPMAAARVKVRPGRPWYLLPLALLLGGVAWLAVGLVSLNNKIDSFQRVALPTSGSTLTLPGAGSYIVYYEAAGAASNPVPSFDLRIEPESGGAATLTAYGSSVTYSFGSHQGRAAATLHVSSPGRYLVVAPGAPSVAAGSDLAFGTGIAGGIVSVVVPTILAMLAGIAGLVVLFVVRFRRISQQRAGMRGGGAYPVYPGVR